MALLSRLQGMIRSRFMRGGEDASPAKAQNRQSDINRPAAPSEGQEKKRMWSQSGRSQQEKLHLALHQMAQATTIPAANRHPRMAQAQPAPNVAKKDSYGTWHQALEKKLKDLSDRQRELRLNALKNQEKPGDATKFAALKHEYHQHLGLLEKAIAHVNEKMLGYKTLQDSGHVLSPVEKREVAELQEAQMQLRMTQLLQPLDRR